MHMIGINNDDAEEFVSEAFSNPQFQEFLKSQTSGNRTLWDKFKDAVFKLLRLPQSARSMFDDVIDLGNQLFAESAAVPREEALTALADDRADAVKAYLADKLDAERVRLTASKVAAEGQANDKSGGASVQFNLH